MLRTRVLISVVHFHTAITGVLNGRSSHGNRRRRRRRSMGTRSTATATLRHCSPHLVSFIRYFSLSLSLFVQIPPFLSCLLKVTTFRSQVTTVTEHCDSSVLPVRHSAGGFSVRFLFTAAIRRTPSPSLLRRRGGSWAAGRFIRAAGDTSN